MKLHLIFLAVFVSLAIHHYHSDDMFWLGWCGAMILYEIIQIIFHAIDIIDKRRIVRGY